jgi:hypothetical protein
MLGPSMMYAATPLALGYKLRVRQSAPEKGLARAAWVCSLIADIVLGVLVVLWLLQFVAVFTGSPLIG